MSHPKQILAIELVDKSDNVISIRSQCDLLNLNRSTFYQPAMKAESLENRKIIDMIDEIYTEYPVYGSRKICVILERMGVKINRKRVQRLMNVMGIESIAPKPNTSKCALQHKVMALAA